MKKPIYGRPYVPGFAKGRPVRQQPLTATLWAGVGVTDITPPLGTELAGQTSWGRRTAVAIHDRLKSKVLLLDNQHERVAIIANDLIGMDGPLCESIREAVHQRTDLDPNRVMITNTHTHNGPATYPFISNIATDTQYLDFLPKYIAGAASQALSSLEQVKTGIAWGNIAEIAYNRAVEDGPLDPSVPILGFERSDGSLLAVLTNYSAHPATVAGPATCSISAGLPWYAVELVEHVHGCVCLYTTGAGGDVNSAYTWQGFSELKSVGASLGGEMLKTIEQMEPLSTSTIHVRSTTSHLPQRPFSNEDKVRVMCAEGRAERNDADWHRAWDAWEVWALEKVHTSPDTGSLAVEIQAVAIGNVAIIAVPCELFTALGVKIKAQSPFDHTIVASCANGMIGYVATPDDYERGGYGAARAWIGYRQFPFLSHVGDVLVNDALSLLRSL
jgi:neutral ceramidase